MVEVTQGPGLGPLSCPLCRDDSIAAFVEVDDNQYWRCEACLLTFIDPGVRPERQAEYAHYLSHENNIEDPGYRRFLSRLSDPMLERLMPGSRGLDYGCGPGPALAHMLGEAGHDVTLYDPFFAPDRSPLTETYDFITCTEVAEHFHAPAKEFALFDRLLKPGGLLGLMTCFQTDDDKFTTWHYRRDPTHVVFYKRETLALVAERLGWSFQSPAKDVVLMGKPGD